MNDRSFCTQSYPTKKIGKLLSEPKILYFCDSIFYLPISNDVTIIENQYLLRYLSAIAITSEESHKVSKNFI